jgi:hypothetical protein
MARNSGRGRGRPPQATFGPLSPLPQPDPPLYEVLRRSLGRTFRRFKLPGFVAIGLAILLGIPAWRDDFIFYMDAAGRAGAEMSLIASLLTSRWASPAIGVLGVLYLIFVGEPNEGKLKSRLWPYFAWTTIAICAAIVMIALYTGLIIERFGPRTLADSQVRLIQSALQLAPGLNYSIGVEDDMTCADCGTYRSEIQDAISGVQGWHVVSGVIAAPGFRSRGLAFVLNGIAEDDPEVVIIKNAFKSAQIDLDIIHEGVALVGPPCELVVVPKMHRLATR